MRKINYGLMSMLTLLMCAITSCGDAERPSYEGPNYILFSDTLTVLAVQNNEEVFDIPVAATEACSYDRTVAVEVIDKKSNAIEGKHYTIESNTITNGICMKRAMKPRLSCRNAVRSTSTSSTDMLC